MREVILFTPKNIIGDCCYYALCETFNVAQKEIQHIGFYDKHSCGLILNLTTGESLRYYINYCKEKYKKQHHLCNEVILCREEHYLICKNFFKNKRIVHDKISLKEFRFCAMEASPLAARNELTPQENEVLLLLLDNKTINQISDFQGVNYKTIHTHLRNISLKLNIRNVKLLQKTIGAI